MNPLPSTELPTATGGNLQTTVYRSLNLKIFASCGCLRQTLPNQNCKITRFSLQYAI